MFYLYLLLTTIVTQAFHSNTNNNRAVCLLLIGHELPWVLYNFIFTGALYKAVLSSVIEVYSCSAPTGE